MSYDKCRQKYLDKILDEFENKKLKLSNNKKVTDRKQAIAIALSMAQDKCKYTNKDLKQVEIKVNSFLLDDNRKISQTRVPLTNVIETQVLIEKFLKDNKKAKAKKYVFLLNQRIFSAMKNNISITKNITNIMLAVNKLFI
tara:strand:- start:174 stop:596 length:423 start_codon:yes stop_codon:yes gene_type:complete